MKRNIEKEEIIFFEKEKKNRKMDGKGRGERRRYKQGEEEDERVKRMGEAKIKQEK